MNSLFELTSSRVGKKSLNSFKQLAIDNGSPHLSYPTIHIAGTNGKGSVAWKLAKILHAGGYKTGLYSSPHIERYQERILVDFKEIPTVAPYRERYPDLNFFELMTLSAFHHFQDEQVEIAIIETGLGGRLDPTNIVDPLISIITSIGIDHVDLLGGSIEAIAREKGGIIKPGKPAIIGPSVPSSIISPIARQSSSPIHVIQKAADYELENQLIVKKAFTLINELFSVTSMQAISSLPPGRREEFHLAGNRTLLLDGGHNTAAFNNLFHSLPKTPEIGIFGFTQSERAASCLNALPVEVQTVILPQFETTSLLHPERIHPLVPKRFKAIITQSPIHALKLVDNLKGNILAAGSFYMISEIRKALEKNLVIG